MGVERSSGVKGFPPQVSKSVGENTSQKLSSELKSNVIKITPLFQSQVSFSFTRNGSSIPFPTKGSDILNFSQINTDIKITKKVVEIIVFHDSKLNQTNVFIINKICIDVIGNLSSQASYLRSEQKKKPELPKFKFTEPPRNTPRFQFEPKTNHTPRTSSAPPPMDSSRFDSFPKATPKESFTPPPASEKPKMPESHKKSFQPETGLEHFKRIKGDPSKSTPEELKKACKDVLGVAHLKEDDENFVQTATKNYKKLSLKLHPDKGGNQEDFQALNYAKETFDILFKKD